MLVLCRSRGAAFLEESRCRDMCLRERLDCTFLLEPGLMDFSPPWGLCLAWLCSHKAVTASGCADSAWKRKGVLCRRRVLGELLNGRCFPRFSVALGGEERASGGLWHVLAEGALSAWNVACWA